MIAEHSLRDEVAIDIDNTLCPQRPIVPRQQRIHTVAESHSKDRTNRSKPPGNSGLPASACGRKSDFGGGRWPDPTLCEAIRTWILSAKAAGGSEAIEWLRSKKDIDACIRAIGTLGSIRVLCQMVKMVFSCVAYGLFIEEKVPAPRGPRTHSLHPANMSTFASEVLFNLPQAGKHSISRGKSQHANDWDAASADETSAPFAVAAAGCFLIWRLSRVFRAYAEAS